MKVVYTQATTNTRSLTQRGGYQSPYSYYWNGAQEVTSDDAYISVGYIETNNLITSLRNASQFMISFWYRDIHNDGMLQDKTLFSISGEDSVDPMTYNYLTVETSDADNLILMKLSGFIGTVTDPMTTTPANIVTYYKDATNINYKIHQFQHNQSANATTDYTVSFTEDTECDVLLVGGGGGGGCYGAGGGGGDVIAYENVNFLSGTYNLKVGNRGLGGVRPNVSAHAAGSSGRTSSIIGNNFTLKAGGGGGAGGWRFPDLPFAPLHGYSEDYINHPFLQIQNYDHLLVWYKFDDGLLIDSMGNYNLETNSAVITETINNKRGSTCAYFNTNNSYLARTSDFISLYDLQQGNGVSICLWFNLKEASDYFTTIFSFGSDHLGPKFVLQRQNLTNTIRIQKIGATAITSDAITIQYDTWTHVTVIVDNVGKWYLYIDGQLANINVTSSFETDFDNTLAFYIGRSSTVEGHDFQGYMDDFRIYDKALTQEEVSNIVFNPMTSGGGGANGRKETYIPGSGNGVSGNGGLGWLWDISGGGGGGGSIGDGQSPIGDVGGFGGSGTDNTFTGITINYGGGGGGGGFTGSGIGGGSSGANGGNNNSSLVSPAPSHQGGGGGGSTSGLNQSVGKGDGGSGLIIIRYKLAIPPTNVINYSPFIKMNKPIDNAWHHYTLYAKSATQFGINIDNHTIAEKTLDYHWIVNLNESNVDLTMSIGKGHQSGEITQSYMSDFRIYNKYDENVIKRLAYVPQYPELRIGASQEYQLAPNVSKSFDNTLIAWYRFDNAPYDLSTLPNYGAFNNIDLTVQNKNQMIVHDTTSPSSGYAYHMETSNMGHYLELSNVEACINATRTIMFWMKNTDSTETIVKTLIEIPTYMNITIDSKINYNVSNITLSASKQLDNNWHHYAFIHNPSGYLDILVDGISMNANVSNVDFITAIADTPMIIGKEISGIYLSDLRFYNNYDIATILYMSKNKPYESASIASYTIGTNVSKDIRPGHLQNFNVWWDDESVEGPTETIVNIINVEAITKASEFSYRNAFAYHFNNTSNTFGAYLKLENGELLEKTLYNRFELSISYWKKMTSYPISTSNEIVIDDIVTISSFESNVQLEMSNINTITTSSNIIALDTWYLYNYVVGYNKKHMSMSISVYDTSLQQMDSQSILLPCAYDISRFKNYSGEIKLVGHSDYQISDFKIYNKLLTNAEIVAQSLSQTNIVFELDVTNVTNKISIEPYNTYGVIASDVGILQPDYNDVADKSLRLGNNNYISIHSNIIDSLYAIEFGFTYWKKNNIVNYNTDFAMYHSNVDGFENHLTLTANTQDFRIYSLEDSFSNENLIIHNTDWHMYTYNMKYQNGITLNSVSYDTTYQTKTKIGFVPFKGFIKPINDIYIGSHEQDTQHITDFYIEDIKVYNSYLTESKVNTMYSNTILPIYTKTEDLSGLKLWYRLQEYTINGVMSPTITNSANHTGFNNGLYAGANVIRENSSIQKNENRNRYSSHSANDLAGHWTTLESNNPIDTNGFSLSNYTDFTIMYKQKILSEVYSSNYTIITNGDNFSIHTPNKDGNITITIGDEFTLSTSINPDLKWVSWAFTMTTANSSNMVEIYKDGLLLANESSSLLNITNTSLKIANVANIDMLLDDVRIYNRALSHNEIHKYAKGNV
jgi:hypothetical protein